MGQDRNHCRDFTSSTVQSENGRVGRYLFKKQEIFTKNNSNPDSDRLSPQYDLAFLTRENYDAPPGAKEIQKKEDSDKEVFKLKQPKNSLGEGDNDKSTQHNQYR